MGECEVCVNKDVIERLKSDVKELQSGTSSTNKKLTETSTKLDILIVNTKEYNSECKQAFKDLQKTVSDLAEKPAKRWDLIVNTTIIGVISALVGAGMVLILIK